MNKMKVAMLSCNYVGDPFR